jgi:flagellum-specific ATP synthase
MILNFDIGRYKTAVENTDPYEYVGSVSRIVGLAVEATGLSARMGDICRISTSDEHRNVLSEVVGFKDREVLLMPFDNLTGVGRKNQVISTGSPLMVPVGTDCLGRVLDALGRPMDAKGPFKVEEYYPVESPPPDPLKRTRINERLPLGIKAIDALLTIGRGQRLGIFAGSGVGKSTLMGMIARNAKADVNVITLVGERGREVRDFIEKDLRKEGLKRSVLVVATSDQPALVRLKSAAVGTTIAEFFRDKGYNVLLLMDSLTRYAMAQREIGMAIGEPPVSRGYTPSVLALLPKLLERSGTSEKGSITGLYTVLVEGDDMNEPVTDAVRGILDGHIVLSRKLAHGNHYPAIDILASISRLMNEVSDKEHIKKAAFIKSVMSVYNDAQDIISIGAYKSGSNPEIDRAIRLRKSILELLKQGTEECFSFEDTMELMSNIYEDCE